LRGDDAEPSLKNRLGFMVLSEVVKRLAMMSESDA
jgi:hypothetical protein